MKRHRTAGLSCSSCAWMQTKYKACIYIYVYMCVHKCIWIYTKSGSNGVCSRNRYWQVGPAGVYVPTHAALLMSCVWNRATSRYQGSSAKASPQQTVFQAWTSASPGCLWWWCLELHEGYRITCFFPFFSKISAPRPPVQWKLQKIFQTSG